MEHVWQKGRTGPVPGTGARAQFLRLPAATTVRLAVLALALLASGCFDWDRLTRDYQPGPDLAQETCTATAECKPGPQGQPRECCNGACVDTQGDVGNCGGCGQACALTSATPKCVEGLCRVEACDKGHADCDNVDTNGCEVTTDSDADHCGACGTSCDAVANGERSCKDGVCGIGSCAAGFADCDKKVQTGCEVSIQTSPDHCGSCDTPCSAIPVGTPDCKAGKCVPVCPQGFADCDGTYENGCEDDTRVDVKNCGTCAKSHPHSLADLDAHSRAFVHTYAGPNLHAHTGLDLNAHSRAFVLFFWGSSFNDGATR